MATLRCCALTLLALTGCGDDMASPIDGRTGIDGRSDGVAGSMRFVLGGTAPIQAVARRTGPSALAPGDGYIVSPRQAKIRFAAVAFRQADGSKLGGGDVPLTDCVVTYDRAMPSGSTLLDCPITMPVGEVASLDLAFDKAMELLVSDGIAGIYSDPAVPSKYATTPPVGGAGFVPYTVTIGGPEPTRATPIVFASPITIAAGSTPTLAVTTDMIQTFQLVVDAGGTTLTASPGNDPIAVFGGLSPGSSHFLSNASQIESYRIGSVNNFRSMRVFYDADARPLFMMSPVTCGVGAGMGVWATGTFGPGNVGGRLGTDVAHQTGWAQVAPGGSSYDAYYVMAEPVALGDTTMVKCQATTTPPMPADGMTYASGAPDIATPDAVTPLTLLAK
ncbi:MAG: hypothetical protein NT062_06875 [Proteobacteria bacterium]|nr:hypothetical protein [Pseudomonadota bacterium]